MHMFRQAQRVCAFCWGGHSANSVFASCLDQQVKLQKNNKDLLNSCEDGHFSNCVFTSCSGMVSLTIPKCFRAANASMPCFLTIEPTLAQARSHNGSISRTLAATM